MPPKPDVTLDHDAVWPRDAEHRYRIYARNGKDLTVLAATPDAGGVGQALVTLHEDARKALSDGCLADYGRIGVLDVIDREWIINPWSTNGMDARLAR